MDYKFSSTTALQMRIEELLRENETLKNKVEEKDKKLNKYTEFLQEKGYDDNYVEMYLSEDEEDTDCEIYNTATTSINREPLNKENPLKILLEMMFDDALPITFTVIAVIVIGFMHTMGYM